jgi:hypothetical protein
MKKTIFCACILALGSAAATVQTSMPTVPTATLSGSDVHISGDYVEVRTASVFAGACHYNGEMMSGGRDALLAIQFSKGTWHGVNLSGVRVVAEDDGSDNLGNAGADRKTVVDIDPAASAAQASAVADLLTTRYHDAFGQIVSIHRTAIAFEHKDRSYRVTAKDFGAMAVDGMPNDECCKQPNLVWYSPLIPLVNRRVGYTKDATFVGDDHCDPWERADENSAFYGQFAF